MASERVRTRRSTTLSALALTLLAGCHRATPTAETHDAGSPAAARAPADDGLSTAPPDVRHVIRAAFALRESSRHANREQLGAHAEVPWLQAHVAWDLLAVLGASHGLTEAPAEMHARLWPAALEDAEHVATRPVDVADLAKSLGESLGAAPCTVGPLDRAATSFASAYLRLEPLAAGLAPTIETRVAPFRARATSVHPTVLVRCATGHRAVAFGIEGEGDAARIVPIVIRDEPMETPHD